MGKNIAIVGKGAREHALCWKLASSPHVSTIYVIPGNGGTATCSSKVKNVAVDYEIETIVKWCVENKIYLVVVGPEQFLAEGISDKLVKHDIKCFGPSKSAARIEADKSWSKSFMEAVGIPTAGYETFSDLEKAVRYIEQDVPENHQIVVKASGLASGKGVIICRDKEQAKAVVNDMIVSESLGEAGKIVLIEEFLEGEEASVLAFCDGKNYSLMLPAQDHKRLKDGDEGPNTGGMGAVCPYQMSADELNVVRHEVFDRAIIGMQTRKCPFKGVLYAGLMLTNNGIKVLEFNCRFGDPETQVLMPLLETDLFPILKACCKGTLDSIQIKWSHNSSVGVVMASGGYPVSSSKESVITGLPLSSHNDSLVFHASTEFKNKNYYAKSGRILTAVAVGSTLSSACLEAKRLCSDIHFEGRQFRNDIGIRAIARYILKKGSRTYKSSGVDISSGNELVHNLKNLVLLTHNQNVVTPLGSFAAAYDPHFQEMKSPLLVTGCDGVGTKIQIAKDCNSYSTIGQDLVAMSVNDILALGAKPLFFLDYVACGVLNVNQTLQLVKGIVDGCKIADCALVGGETAEMPGIFKKDEYELAGFVVGVVDKPRMLPSTDIVAGDRVIYLPSSGLHSNGFSLIRKIMEERGLSYKDKAEFSTENLTYGQEFLKPTKIYVQEILNLLKDSKIKAFAHITGGGLPENVVRVLPKNIVMKVNASKWNIPPVFGWIAAVGEVGEYEVLRTFNCGVGGVVIVSSENAENVAKLLNSNVIGKLDERIGDESQFTIINFESQMKKLMNPFIRTLVEPHVVVKRVAVLISGLGSNMEALIKGTFGSWSVARVVLVISDKASAKGVNIARGYNIRAEVIERQPKESRENHENRIQQLLEKERIDIVCLAGYMKILTASFVNPWRGKLINIHPSLLPSFRGINAQQQAIDYGIRFSGCTVHFVEVEIDAGAIIEQAVVPVFPEDTEETLAERIKEKEHEIFPRALKLVASGKVKLDLKTGKIKRN